MALLGRANVNVHSLLSYSYCKFITSTVKFKSSKHSSISNLLNDKLRPNAEREMKNDTSKVMTFENEIDNRRNQACRSILVQVYSSNSYDDLQNYCSQFGKILSMHHYRLDKQQNFILIEFKDITAVSDIMSYASFVDSELIAPVKSSVLWFRKGQLINLYGSKKKLGLATQNGFACPNDRQIADKLQSAKSISGQIIALYDMLKINDLETRLRFHTACHLEQYFSGLFCNMKVLLFGSSVNGFGKKRCDLDLVLVPDDTEKHKPQSRLVFHAKPMQIMERYETKEFMGILASTMQHFIPGIRNVRRILEARVPIIKFNYEYTHMECDLSTTNMTAIYMSELLNLYSEIDWRVRPFIITIRKWARKQDLTSDSPGQWITNFSLTLLAIFYLQQKKVLPSLKILKSYATRDDTRLAENGINCTFLRDVQKLPAEYKYKSNQDNLEMLLYGFFEYYSVFDFYTKGICIREGVPIQKPSRSALHIVNPLETTLNVSKNVNIYELNRITEKAHDAVFVLETADSTRNGSWGLMTLLKMNNVTCIPKLNSAKGQSIDNHSENYSHEVFEKDASEIDIDVNQPKKNKTTI